MQRFCSRLWAPFATLAKFSLHNIKALGGFPTFYTDIESQIWLLGRLPRFPRIWMEYYI